MVNLNLFNLILIGLVLIKRISIILDWELLPFSFNFPAHPECIFEKPSKLEEMTEIARKLSKDLIFARIDLYWVQNRIYFGEITFFPAAGLGRFKPEKYDKIIGDMLIWPCK